jgi:hypothetical protein
MELIVEEGCGKNLKGDQRAVTGKIRTAVSCLLSDWFHVYVLTAKAGFETSRHLENIIADVAANRNGKFADGFKEIAGGVWLPGPAHGIVCDLEEIDCGNLHARNDLKCFG